MQDILNLLQEHWQLTSALIAVLFLLIIIEFIKQKRGANGLTPASTTHFINHKNAVVIDTRSTDSYSSGHIVGSVSIPLADLVAKNKKIEKFKTQPIVLVCNSDPEGQRAANQLQTNGFDVYILAGGLRAWRDAELPLVKS